MARRRRNSETLESGSDSFLDIVANIVGILIILIVIAGVRLSQSAPEENIPVVVYGPEITEDQLHFLHNDAYEAEKDRVHREAERILAARAAYEREPQIDFSSQLGVPVRFAVAADPAHEQQKTDQQRRLATTAEEVERLRSQYAAERNELQNLAAAVQQIEQSRHMQSQEVKRQSDEKTQLLAQLASATRTKANLDEQLVLLQREGEPAETLRHSMVPVSRLASGQEWHFEIRGGRVAFIPLDELLGELKRKVDRWAEWIAKYDTHEGVVGPIEGYSLEYKVSKQSASLADELTGGRGTFRVGIDRWELIPGTQVISETYAEAARQDSMFRSALNRCSLDDTITFWVYPDSFEMYQQLSQISHQLGYQVAGRPLPKDRRIGGSPDGSKSFSQ